MITTKQQAQIVQNRINAIASELGYTFTLNVAPTQGEFVKGASIINAIFIEQPSVVVPLRGLNSYYASNIFRMAVKTITPNLVEEMDNLLHTVIGGTTTNVGLRGTTSSETDAEGAIYACVTNCSMPTSSEKQILPMIGECVVYEMQVYFQLIEGGILSNATAYGLEIASSTEISWLSDLESQTVRARVPQTDNIANQSEMQSVIGQQGLTFTLNIPYLTGAIYKTLITDILTGGLSRVYRLSYMDANNNYPEATPLQWYVVLKEGSIMRQAGKVITISCTFLIASSAVYATQIAEF